MLETLWEYLDFTRIYTKPKGQLPDYNEPVILRRDNRTVEGFVNKIHRTLLKDFKHALVWGSSVKHNPQVSLPSNEDDSSKIRTEVDSPKNPTEVDSSKNQTEVVSSKNQTVADSSKNQS